MSARLIDVHVHVTSDPGLEPPATPDHVLRLMDRNGIESAIVSPIATYPTPLGVLSSVAQNNQIAELVRRRSDRFPRGLGVIEPRHGMAALPEVDRVLGELGLSGLMFDNDASGIPIDGPAMLAILQRAAIRGKAIVELHTAPYSVLKTPFRAGRVAEQFPDLTFIALSSFHDITQDVWSVDLARRHPNLLFDISQSKTLLDTVEHATEAGPERILFGTGIPEGDRFYQQEMVRIAHIDESAKNLILAGNARRIFGLA
jgi:uncharacterized protein